MRTVQQIKLSRAFIERAELIATTRVHDKRSFIYSQEAPGQYENSLLSWIQLLEVTRIAREGLEFEEVLRKELDNITEQIALLRKEMEEDEKRSGWYFIRLGIGLVITRLFRRKTRKS